MNFASQTSSSYGRAQTRRPSRIDVKSRFGADSWAVRFSPPRRWHGPLPTVSVVVPLFNYQDYLRECVESALAQQGVKLEVLIVDDCSTDASADIAKELSERDARVTLVQHDSNRGHIETFNHALDLANNEFIVKLDADDCLTAGSLARATALMRLHSDVAFVYGRPEVFTTSPPPTVRLRPSSWTIWRGDAWAKARVLRGHNPIMQPEVMIRRSALRLVGGHSAEVPGASDFNLWLRLSMVGSVARINGAVQGYYRVHSANMHTTTHGDKVLEVHERWKAIEMFLDAVVSTNLGHLNASAKTSFARDTIGLAERTLDQGEPGEVGRALLDFAASLAPEVTLTDRFASIERRLHCADASDRYQPRHLAARLRRDLEDRLRWRLWRRFGV